MINIILNESKDRIVNVDEILEEINELNINNLNDHEFLENLYNWLINQEKNFKNNAIIIKTALENKLGTAEIKVDKGIENITLPKKEEYEEKGITNLQIENIDAISNNEFSVPDEKIVIYDNSDEPREEVSMVEIEEEAKDPVKLDFPDDRLISEWDNVISYPYNDYLTKINQLLGLVNLNYNFKYHDLNLTFSLLKRMCDILNNYIELGLSQDDELFKKFIEFTKVLEKYHLDNNFTRKLNEKSTEFKRVIPFTKNSSFGFKI